MPVSEVKGYKTGKNSAWSTKKVFLPYFDSFSPPNTKQSEIKAFLNVSLVSLTLRSGTVF